MPKIQTHIYEHLHTHMHTFTPTHTNTTKRNRTLNLNPTTRQNHRHAITPSTTTDLHARKQTNKHKQAHLLSIGTAARANTPQTLAPPDQ